MTSQKEPKLLKLLKRYKYYLLAGLLVALSSITAALSIYSFADESQANYLFWQKLADFLMTFGETILGAGLIGGGIGGSINFIFEEMKKEEEQQKERLKESQENREKRKVFRRDMQHKLQLAHDNVELARVLIKSHRSGKTYGEQIRQRIMPGLIGLLEFKRCLNHTEDQQLHNNLIYLKVSLNYMIAFLTALIEEFESHYLEISNLQNYQDAIATRMRTLYTEIAEGKVEAAIPLEKKKQFLKKAENLFGNTVVPNNIEVVWQAIESLDYISDFINELRNEHGKRSMYYQYFLQHYAHCRRILKLKGADINEKLCSGKNFIANMEEIKRIENKKKSDQPLTNRDNLTRKIVEQELLFDFETGKKRVPAAEKS